MHRNTGTTATAREGATDFRLATSARAYGVVVDHLVQSLKTLISLLQQAVAGLLRPAVRVAKTCARQVRSWLRKVFGSEDRRFSESCSAAKLRVSSRASANDRSLVARLAQQFRAIGWRLGGAASSESHALAA